MSSSSISPTPFEREVASRFGLVPNFFVSAPDAPEIVERLWAFAVSAYFDNPMPSLFKERLFVTSLDFARCAIASSVTARFCSATDIRREIPSVSVQSVEQVVAIADEADTLGTRA